MADGVSTTQAGARSESAAGGGAAHRDGEAFNQFVIAALATIPYVGPQVAEYYSTYLASSHVKRRAAIVKVVKAPFAAAKRAVEKLRAKEKGCAQGRGEKRAPAGEPD